MTRRTFVPVALLLVAATLSPAPAPALPPGPPEIRLHVSGDDDRRTFTLVAEASDPDGVVREIEICVFEALSPRCSTSYAVQQGPHSAALACVTGDHRVAETRHRFAAPGVYRVTATAHGGGCPGIGADAATTFETEVVVRDLSVPSAIPCAVEGAPVSTEVGVSAERVRIGAVMSLTGAEPVGGDALAGMRAAVVRVNEAGGICDRELELLVRDDRDTPEGAADAVEALIDEGVFAFVAMPTRDAFQAAIPLLEQHGVDAVGTLGATAHEFASPVVWPAGPSNATFARIAVREAYQEGARRFALAVQKDRALGAEIRSAARDAIDALPDAELVSDVEVGYGSQSINAAATTMQTDCADTCDRVVVGVMPILAIQLFNAMDAQGFAVPAIASHHSFHERVAKICGARCDDVRWYTGFHPPVGAAPDEAYLLADRLDPSVPRVNDVVVAAYAGTLAAALSFGRVGVNLTRDGLRVVLGAGTFDTTLTGAPTSWVERRDASRSMRGYDAVYAQGSFVGYRARTGWVHDAG